jgi:hypothetical protein
MILTTVLASVNNNPNYYMFIPKQISFWKKINIKFIAVFIGENIPNELLEYNDNIILYNKNLDLNTVYVGQNIRMYYTALLKLPENELVMITDMDMLPTNDIYYKNGLEHFTKDDFIYYRNIDGNQIYMCYNAAHPDTWGKVFSIKTIQDIESIIYTNYQSSYNGIPGSHGWFIDQEIMYKKLIHYPNLKVLNRPIKRLEVYQYKNHVNNNDCNFLLNYDDVHFHRNYFTNESLICHAEHELYTYKK